MIEKITMSTSLLTFAITDAGLARRRNEDCFLVASAESDATIVASRTAAATASIEGGDQQLLAVADGMGWHAAGNLASAIAINTLRASLNRLHVAASEKGRSARDRMLLDGLRQTVRQANRRIFHESSEHPELSGMGTTLTAALVHDRNVWIAHVGDSRCYVVRNSELIQLTTDHNLATLLKQIDPDSVDSGSGANVLWNCLGGTDIRDLEIEVKQCVLQPSDYLLLCTDGLVKHVDDEEISSVISSAATPEQACRRLVEMAKQRGGRDNITIVLGQHQDCGQLEPVGSASASDHTNTDLADTWIEHTIGPLGTA
ncbi:Serine/threonine phosphatase stp [Fuerstiella marisgermanici]|uniref:Serine/threonine phosphatase stp n=2 Tax=Fuerstiella marisgermanici TaxID=1891926 RepID=A0A1P8WCR9_9PLAN|nr:Serine/threonine phosphatase stp [Fuerstiella marisgermanici]